MGGESEQEENRSPRLKDCKTIEEYFNELLPYYLAMGMTYDDYWNGDCLMVKYYLKADKIRQERDNETAWLQGLYIYEALCDVAPVLHAFAKRGTKPMEYPKSPYSLGGNSDVKQTEEEKNQQKLRELREKLIRMANKNG